MNEGEGPSNREVIISPEKKRWLPYEKVASKLRVSRDRLRRLLNTGMVEGEKRDAKTSKGVREKWFTTWEQAGDYFLNRKPTPSEAGRRPPREGMSERGRPKSFRRSGVVFEAS